MILPRLARLVFASCVWVPLVPAQNNVLVLLADDLGIDAVGAYGVNPNAPPTPNLDALAGRGVLFRNCWANATCSPTRAAIMTGRYGTRTRIGHLVGQGSLALSEQEWTIPEVLDAGNSGYAHGAFGKWHLGYITDPTHPNRMGWSHFAGLIGGAVPDFYAWGRTVNGSSTICETYATTQTVDDTIDWIRQQPGPWVAYVAFAAVHFPYHAPPAHLHTQNLTGLDPDVTPGPFFTAMVEAMDNEIGRLFAELGPTLQDTDVIVLGDNGTDNAVCGAPFTRGRCKSTPYQAGVGVPLIVSGPSVQQIGREVDALVGAVDVFATVTDLAGVDARAVVPPLSQLDAVSFAPYLTDPVQPPIRSTIFAERWVGTAWAFASLNGWATVRDAQHKLIRYYRPNRPPYEELFDLAADPYETVNLLQSPPPLSPTAQAALASLQNEIDAVRRMQGAIGSFGTTTCTGSNGSPTIAATGLPLAGSSYDVSVTNGPANQFAALLIGVSDEFAPAWGLPLPFDMLLLGGGSGCMLWTSGELAVGTTTTAAGDATVRLDVPPGPELVGERFFHSWILRDPSAPLNFLEWTTSDALEVLVGN